MGRWNFSSKQEADYLKQISVFVLKKYNYFNRFGNSGVISWSRNGEKTGSIGIESFMGENEEYIKLKYTQTDNYTGEKKNFDYKIKLTTTPCHFGGKRYWFICPLSKNGVYCGRRVGVLYKAGDYFGCRHCYNLTYSSRKENRRYKNYPLFFWLKTEQKIEELEKEIKRRYYKGKPTRT